MSDPLSIAASVTGILAVAGKLASVILDFISNVADAPKSAQTALRTIEDMRLIIGSIKHLLDIGLSRVPESRKDMIHVGPLVIIFRESIISFSELEAMISGAAVGQHGRFKWAHIKWVLEQDKFVAGLQRLESHKVSLSVMLNILHCQSDLEAQQNIRSLQDTLQLLVQQNQAILRRFEQCNQHLNVGNGSIRFFDDDRSTIRARQDPDPGAPPRTDQLPVTRLATLSELTDPVSAPGVDNVLQDFETCLQGTRVYRRARLEQNDDSGTAIYTNTWSVLSDLSLKDVSVISVISLPLSLEEINNIGPQLTFANILQSHSPSKEVVVDLDAAKKNWLVLDIESPLLGLDQLGIPGSMSISEPPILPDPPEQSSVAPSRNEDMSLDVAISRHESKQEQEIAAHQIIAASLLNTKPQRSNALRWYESGTARRRSQQQKRKETFQALQLHSLVVVGAGGVDKSALTLKFLWPDQSYDEWDPTIKDECRRTVKVDGKLCVIEVLDTTGQEEYSSMREMYYRDGEGFIIVFSVCDRSSFDAVKDYNKQLSRSTVRRTVILFGNHSNRQLEREVSREAGLTLAKDLGCHYFEGSSETGFNVDEAFQHAVRMIRLQPGIFGKISVVSPGDLSEGR